MKVKDVSVNVLILTYAFGPKEEQTSVEWRMSLWITVLLLWQEDVRRQWMLVIIFVERLSPALDLTPAEAVTEHLG